MNIKADINKTEKHPKWVFCYCCFLKITLIAKPPQKLFYFILFILKEKERESARMQKHECGGGTMEKQTPC